MIDNNKEIRWKQRFSNFEKSFLLVSQYIDKPLNNQLEKAGMIQFFEITFELSWKLMKDYLEAHEFIVKSPREAVKQAFQYGLIEDGHIWMDALSDRNLTVHTYDEKLAEQLVKDIVHKYYPELNKLYNKLLKES